MSSSNIGLIAAIVILLLISIVLAAAETSLNRISKVKAQSLVDATDSSSARSLYRLVSEPESFINPLLLTVLVIQTGQTFLTSRLASSLSDAWWVSVLFFVLNVVVVFVVAESLPKTWAVLAAERAALATARVTEFLVRFPPLRLISRGLIGLTNVLIPGKGLKQGPFVSEQELLGIVEAAADDEVIEHEERQLIESIIEFGDTVAREIMVPRPDMIISPNEATVSGALDQTIAHGISRLPIHADQGDDIVGLVFAKDLIRAEREGQGDSPALDLARPVHFIPENKPVARLMREMQAGKFHLAIVADEYGGIAGLVTLEDCLEELVGEIVDEYDTEELLVQRLPTGEYLVDGGLPVHELNELLDIEVPNEEWESVGGFVFGTLGHVPAVGDSVEFDGWHFSAEELDGRRIRSVRVTAAPETDDWSGRGADEPTDE